MSAVYFRVRMVQLIRMPTYAVPTLGFPALLFLFFSLGRPLPTRSANEMLTGFSIFAILGVVFFQFGVGIASDRTSPWERYLRTLPATAVPRFVAQAASGVAFGSIAVLIVVVVAAATTEARLPAGTWGLWAASLLLGALPFTLFGITLGYWTDPRAALPIANVIYLPLSYLGGLWTGPQALPDVIRGISVLLPTRHYAEAIWAVVRGGPIPLDSWLWLGLFGTAGFILALWGYWRDEELNYR
jgi:ABC-2 type transport system permease protein